ADANVGKKIGFWETLLNYVELKHLDVETDEGVHFLWKSRLSNTLELAYQEIRRVSFYNSSSYKKKAHIHVKKNFAFLKVVDELNAHVKSTPLGVEIELYPNGSVSLDYGFYE